MAVVGFVSAQRKNPAELQKQVGETRLVGEEGQRISIATNRGGWQPGEPIRVGEMVTVSFTVENIDDHPITFQRLGMGGRGPEATCKQPKEQKWSWQNTPFSEAENLIVQPGERYTYIASRVYSKPGSYFVEPILQDVFDRWGGVPPFSCVDLMVVE